MDGQLPQPNIQLFSSLLTSLLLVSPFLQSRYSAHVRCPSAALTPLSALPFTFFTSFILPSLINIEGLASKNDFWPYQNENSARINSIIKKVLLRNSQLCPGLWSIVSCKNVVRCKSHQVFPQEILHCKKDPLCWKNWPYGKFILKTNRGGVDHQGSRNLQLTVAAPS